ncbi:MAG: matrixin family metalloprotease [Blastocatellia bacterium]
MKQVWRTLLELALAVVVFCLLALPANATSFVMLSDTELIVNSRLIVTGRVVSTIGAWDDSGSMVWTYVKVRVDRVLKGESPGRTVVLKQLGGAVGEAGIRVYGQPGFSAGERVLLYLNTGTDGTLHTAHAFMGKFAVIEDRLIGAEFAERSVSDEVESLAHYVTGDITNRAPMAAYVDKIQKTLQQETARIGEIDSRRTGEPIVVVPPEYSKIKLRSSDFTPQFVFFSGGVRWMEADSGQTIPYYVNPSSSPVSGGATAEITRALNAWPNQSGAAIRLQIAGQTGSCGIRTDNTNTISFGDCLNQLDPPVGACSGIVALTAISWVRDARVIGGSTFNRLVEADIIFNKGMDCFLGTPANLAEVACHELGHSIGLDHSADPSAIMWASSHGRGHDAVLGADDKAGVLAVYPASPGGGPAPGGGAPLSISTLSVNDGFLGRSYFSTLAAAGGTPPYRWSLVGGSLPPGLNLSANGTIEGVPTSTSTYSFAAQVFDSSNPSKADSRWFSIAIKTNDPGIPGFPVITRVKVKGDKKLRIWGENFRANSLIVLNGLIFDPISFEQDGTSGMFFVKGKLNLRAPGTNSVVIISDNNSAPYVF